MCAEGLIFERIGWKANYQKDKNHPGCIAEHVTSDEKNQYTITLKIADQGWSDLHVVFTMILCGANFCIW